MKIVAVFTMVTFFFACNQHSNEFKKLNHTVDFKFIQFGDGEHPTIGDYIEVNLMVTDTSGDTMHYVPNYPYFIKLQQTALDSAWQTIKLGDSICFRLPRLELNRFYKFYQVMQSNEGEVLMHARLKGIYDSTEMEVAKRTALSSRELEEQKEFHQYLKNINSPLDTLDGGFRIVTTTTDTATTPIRYGSEVSIHYTGRFINGYTFDNTYTKGVTPTFIYGKEYQMIEGMKMGINGLKEGESVKIILSSRRAFGEDGSLAGIVPPYTAVIFDVEIIKVIN